MLKGDHACLKRALNRTAKCKKKVSLMIHGTTAIGKTQSIIAYAKEQAKLAKLRFSMSIEDINKEDVYYLCILPLHLFDLAQLLGLPFPNDDRTMAEFLSLGMIPKKGQGIIFLDEINLALPSVLNNAYQMILDRKLGSQVIPSEFMMVAAGNLVSDRANIQDMPFPLRGRFTHMELESPKTHDLENPSAPSWYRWANENGIHSAVINYVLNSGNLNAFNGRDDIDDNAYAMALPRTWEFTSDLLYANEVDMKDYATIKEIVDSTTSLGNEFVAFLKFSEGYDVPKILKEEKISLKNPSPDVVYSLFAALVTYYRENVEKDLSLKMFKISKSVPTEYQMMFLSQLNGTDKEYFTKLQKSMPATEFNVISEKLLAIAL